MLLEQKPLLYSQQPANMTPLWLAGLGTFLNPGFMRTCEPFSGPTSCFEAKLSTSFFQLPKLRGNLNRISLKQFISIFCCILSLCDSHGFNHLPIKKTYATTAFSPVFPQFSTSKAEACRISKAGTAKIPEAAAGPTAKVWRLGVWMEEGR